jgi:DNA topoisomerase-1
MQPARMEQTSADINTTDDKYSFRAIGQTTLFDGFIKIYTEGKDENGNEEPEGALPPLAKSDKISAKEINPFQHFTEPPARYTDATLVKILESYGVGRPSTYAPTLSTIQERGYVEKIEKKYHPTEIGFLVSDMLVEHFPEIIDVNFTAHIEEELDEIAQGQIPWVNVCREFYEPFKKHLEAKEIEVEKNIQISDTPCPHCGKPMLIKFGRMGKFLACPEGAKVTLPMPEEAAKIKELEEKTRDERCPICGKPMKVKRGRFGYFLGCVDYPECKGISRIWNKIGFKCPLCPARITEQDGKRSRTTRSSTHSTIAQGGELGRTMDSGQSDKLIGDIVEKRGRGRGRPFWACTRWPDCNFIINKKPETEKELLELYKQWKKKPGKPEKKKVKSKK